VGRALTNCQPSRTLRRSCVESQDPRTCIAR
jgi:hypothetical protein